MITINTTYKFIVSCSINKFVLQDLGLDGACKPSCLTMFYSCDVFSDINECETLKPCNGTCHNVPGSYYCSCPIEYEGDGWKNGTGCSHKGHQAKRIPFIHIALG